MTGPYFMGAVRAKHMRKSERPLSLFLRTICPPLDVAISAEHLFSRGRKSPSDFPSSSTERHPYSANVRSLAPTLRPEQSLMHRRPCTSAKVPGTPRNSGQLISRPETVAARDRSNGLQFQQDRLLNWRGMRAIMNHNLACSVSERPRRGCWRVGGAGQ